MLHEAGGYTPPLPGPQTGRYIAKIVAGGNQGNWTRNRQVLIENAVAVQRNRNGMFLEHFWMRTVYTCCWLSSAIFFARECTHGSLIYVCLYCVNSGWSTWVVRVGVPQKIFKPHSQISRLGMWTICFHTPKDYILGLFLVGKIYDYVVNCIFSKI